MAIGSSDIHYRMSGGASNSDPAAALGGAKSSVSFSTNAVFDDVTSAEAGTGDAEYRCFYVHNAHATLTLVGAKIWIQSQTSSADTDVALALGGEGLNGTAETVANEGTAPTGETFSQPSSYSGGLTIGDLAPGEHYPVWIRRTVNAAAAGATDTYTVRVQGDTLP
jgi:hypothetical protein